MHKLLILLTSACLAQTTVTGLLQTPSGTPFSGKILISLPIASVVNTCVTPVQVLTFRPVTIQVSGGTMPATSLYATPCLKPQYPYIVRFFNTQNTQLYSAKWRVPNVSLVDLTVCDVTELANLPIYEAVTVLVSITGNGAAQQLQTSGTAKFIQYQASQNNANPVRIGNSATSSTFGQPLLPGQQSGTPPINTSLSAQVYDLSSIFIYASPNDKVAILYGN